tara:strand:+ start:156 stop:1694 length:1539 start_codon:yes stop_codon:yes gene_type:complete
MPHSKVAFSIPAVNDSATSLNNANQLTGGFSFNKGNANVRFSISAQERMIDTSDMYLTGQIVYLDPSGNPITDGTVAAPVAAAAYNAGNGATLTRPCNTNISNWSGIQNSIKRIFVQSKKTSVEIAQHNNYPMYVGTRTGWQNSPDDFLISPLARYDALGSHASDGNRHQSVMCDATATSSPSYTNISNINDKHYGRPFSFKLDTALLNNPKHLHLGQSYLGGLIVNLELNNDAGYFYERFRSQGANHPSAQGSYYIIKNLRLQGRFIVPTPQDMASYQPQMMLNDRINLVNDIVSSVNSSKYTPNVSMVKSFVNLFIEQDQENNIKKNQSNFRLPIGLREYTQNKNNVRAPEDFVIEVSPNLLTKSARNGKAGPVSAQNYIQKMGSQGDAEVRNRWQRAVLSGDIADKCSATLTLSDDSLEEDYATGGDADNGAGNNCKADLMGIGLDYTHHFGNTANFNNQDYDLIIRSGVQSGDAVLPASRNNAPEIQETYVKMVSVFNTQTLVKTINM